MYSHKPCELIGIWSGGAQDHTVTYSFDTLNHNQFNVIEGSWYVHIHIRDQKQNKVSSAEAITWAATVYCSFIVKIPDFEQYLWSVYFPVDANSGVSLIRGLWEM